MSVQDAHGHLLLGTKQRLGAMKVQRWHRSQYVYIASFLDTLSRDENQ